MSNLIKTKMVTCNVRVVDGLCKVHTYQQNFLDTVSAVEDALDRFEQPIFSVKVVAVAVSSHEMRAA